MSAADELRALTAAATPVELIVWLVNHADALADLIEWAANDAEHHPQCTIDDCRCGLDEALAALDADR